MQSGSVEERDIGGPAEFGTASEASHEETRPEANGD
jgi:hypothetical protein